MDISIIIVSYNTCQLTVQTLQSIYKSDAHCTYEIIVIDNHSKDNSVKVIRMLFPSITLIQNEENVGFSGANNQGIRMAQGRYLLLLNSDTIIQKDTLNIMLQYMDGHCDVGTSGCKVVLPDGSLDKACKRGFPTPSASFYYAFGFSKLFPNLPRFNQYQLGYLKPDEEHEVDCLIGAFMLLRRETIDQVGLLDETFFMYGEDIDWCYRIKQRGWKVMYYPMTQIIHYKKASSRQRRSYRIIYEFHRSMLLFHNKHYKMKYPWIINIAVYIGVGLKYIQSVLCNVLNAMRWSS